MATGTVLYGITAKLVVEGRTVDLLGFRTVRSNEVDDACQELRRELRPTYGEGLRIDVAPAT